jgi:beta-N-acetylhexosaminidase
MNNDLDSAISATLLPGYRGTVVPDLIKRRLRSGLAGVCVYGPNIESPGQLRAMAADVSAANPHAIVAIDEEGGDVTRLHYMEGSPYPGNAVLGRLDDLELTERVASEVGFALRGAGFNLSFAPDADVNSNPDNPVIGVRSFGADPEHVSLHTAAWTHGLQSTGVAACAKHFPGHGDTAVDSHLALPIVDRPLEQLRSGDLLPFRAAITAGTATIMTSHIMLPALDRDNPATFSERILDGLLRRELGFDGVIVSDALDMRGASGETGIPEAAVRALAAGCDLLCIGSETTDELLDEIIRAVSTAVESGRLPAARLADAANRVNTLTERLAHGRDAIQPRARPACAIDSTRAIRAFEVSHDAEQSLSGSRGYAVLRIETEPNIAIGTAPWGPFAQSAADPAAADSREFSAAAQFTLTGDEDPAAVVRSIVGQVTPDQVIVVIGKQLHLSPHARVAADLLRATRPTVVVDMGWPSEDRAYADVVTYGASRLIGRALIEHMQTLVGRDRD